ncbi:MAG TPA: hypothetical protein VJK51_00975 [Candidatus Nanoarchaeia archaeon]|nr:hypothetical protein [Candidatus Nanoarchaeia archaeon]
MNTQFKRHQAVILLHDADPEYVEYHLEGEDENTPKIPIKKGMKGRINILLSNGRYHVEILNDQGKTLAYAPFNEEDLQADDE